MSAVFLVWYLQRVWSVTCLVSIACQQCSISVIHRISEFPQSGVHCCFAYLVSVVFTISCLQLVCNIPYLVSAACLQYSVSGITQHSFCRILYLVSTACLQRSLPGVYSMFAVFLPGTYSMSACLQRVGDVYFLVYRTGGRMSSTWPATCPHWVLIGRSSSGVQE
jgi:hypothetical protein